MKTPNNNMKTEITRIKIQLKDRAVELTAQEARDLQAELNKLFELAVTEKVITKEIHHHHTTPIYVDRYGTGWPNRWEIYCGTDTSKADVLCMNLGQVS